MVQQQSKYSSAATAAGVGRAPGQGDFINFHDFVYLNFFSEKIN
jgi:hypothetical protein